MFENARRFAFKIFHAPLRYVERECSQEAGKCRCGEPLGEMSEYKCDYCTMEGWI